MTPIEEKRRERQAALFGGRLPELWCPLLTHFQAKGMLDEYRLASQLTRISPWVKGLLVPGSTGEGWEMNDEDIRRLLQRVLDIGKGYGIRLLVGILKTETEDVLRAIDDLGELLQHPCVLGITVCPPKAAGQASDLIRRGLEQVLQLGYNTALYQLPQVTGNEMSPELVRDLAAGYDNFILFKDTSGTDRVVRSGVDLGNVFLVRGSEQAGYAPWLRSGGGLYDGLLLSTANVFAEPLTAMLRALRVGEREAAEAISSRLSQLVGEAFEIVQGLPIGNPFTNANKLMDHLFAFGPHALETEPPMLYSGHRLPWDSLRRMHQLFERHQLSLGQGYCLRR